MMRSLMLVLCLAPLAALAGPSSTFDNGAEGWSAVDLNPPYDSAGTLYTVVHESGYIRFADPSSQSFFFEAPSAFLGNLSSYFGGTLRYSQRLTPTTPEWRDDPDVVLIGGGVTLVFQNAANPGSDWTDYAVSLTAPGWHVGSLSGAAASAAQLQGVLGAVGHLRIRGEYISGVVETTALDNVSISAVPEPGAWALMLSGLGFLGCVVYRRSGA